MDPTDGSAQYSILGFDPRLTFVGRGEEVRVNDDRVRVDSSYEYLQGLYHQLREQKGLGSSNQLVGYFSYDCVKQFESIPTLTRDDLRLPEAHFILPSVVLYYDHYRREIYSNVPEPEIAHLLKEEVDLEDVTVSGSRSNMEQDEYETAVEDAIEYILDGDIFQVVLSRRTEARFKGDHFRMYEALREINPSPYMFLLDFDETCLIGASPEMLVRLQQDVLTTKPIAGTRPRSANVEEDEKLKVELLLDEKERAEHVMLVDLHRNDLGRISEYGTVKVNQFMNVEKFSHVQHIVSEVQGILREGHDAFDALRAVFPAGTVSGAPKIRAMELIEQFEPTRRGPYAGVVGYFDLNGNMDFAINIRSLLIKHDRVFVQAGAGIVADSVPEREFMETEHKMRAMIKALEG